jgi:YVTN family beta-propeller protein
MRRVAVLFVILLLALTSGETESGVAGLAPGVRMFPVPTQVLTVCHRAQAKASFRVLCPARLPHASVGYPSSPPNPLTARVLRDRGTLVGIEFGYGAPYPRGQARNHPGRFLHLAVLRGDVPVAAPPRGSTPLGDTILAGREGKLFQAPQYSASRWGAYHGNHLIFTWREKGSAYTISLHSWRRHEALQLLGKVIDSLRPAIALPSPQRPAPLPGVSQIRVGDPSGICLTCLAVNGGVIWAAEYYVGVHRVDLERGEIIGKPIDVKRFPSDIAATEEDVWVVGATQRVDRIDAGRGQVRATIPVGPSPSAIAVGDRYVWVASYADGSLTRIDARTNHEVGRPIRIGGGPNNVAFSDGAIWVTDFDGRRILRVDESTGETIAAIRGGGGLSSIATTREAIWVTDWDRNELMRIDPGTNRVIARIPMGPAPAGVAAHGTSVWVTDYWDGTVTRVDSETNKVMARIQGMKHPTQVAVSRGRVLVLDAASGSLVQIPIPEAIGRIGDERGYGWLLVVAAALAFAAFVVWRQRRRRLFEPTESSPVHHDR